MLARLCAFLVWALVAATAVFWGLRLAVSAPSAPSYAVAVGEAGATRGDLGRLLGSAPVPAMASIVAPEASSRFRLLGIMAPKFAGASAPASHGVALIAVDGKMPKAYSVGSRLDGELVLQSVSLRTVSIASKPGAPAITLQLPAPAAAATGPLPPPSLGGGYVPPPVSTPSFQPAPPQIAPPVFQPQTGGTPVPPRNESNPTSQ